MYEVESETVLNSITSLLRSTFSTEEIRDIYKDYVVQGAKEPFIVVKQINFTDYLQVRPHHSLRYMIDIRFHPVKKAQRHEQWGRNVSYKALQALQKDLNLFGQKIHFTSTETTYVDEVTHLLLVFSFFVREVVEDDEDMRKIRLRIRVRSKTKKQQRR